MGPLSSPALDPAPAPVANGSQAWPQDGTAPDIQEQLAALALAPANGHAKGAPGALLCAAGPSINGSDSSTSSAEDGGCPEDGEAELPAVYPVPSDPIQGFGIDARDANTPDRWIPRHPDLIRLTGKHPFNCEPPLEKLVDHGFITPASIHYVRNHGYVPQGDWDTWQLEVTGLVGRPCVLSMADLVAMPSRTLPVTLVCVGNRRKEQNMVKKTRGFSWGAAGLSTSVWKGVPLRDVLLRCGVLPARSGAQFVCFEGAETLPGQAGQGSTYGTSITRARAMDPSMDVILAYEQNGERLLPDHGYPLRLIIPGYIGGRMVKWLRKVEVTSQESQNYYHFYDNRVLPPFVDSERADAERWWYKPEYICNELSINSAASAPAHNEELLLQAAAGSNPSAPMSYVLKGYAYSGGGRKVTRVELALDGGANWRLAELAHPETPTQYGRFWCWCFWELRVDVADLVGAREVAVRAWDEATNTQPERLTWNVLGMMNNCWFRIKIHPVMTAQGLALRFEHPTLAGAQTGGWMDAENSHAAAGPSGPAKTSVPEAVVAKAQGAKAAAAGTVAVAGAGTGAVAVAGAGAGAEGVVKAAASASGLRRIPLWEVQKHDSEASAWIVVDGGVYDCTPFLRDHPGGAESILINAGTDCTEEFDAIHSRKAKGMLREYLIGEVDPEATTEPDAALAPAAVAAASLDQVVPEEQPSADGVVLAAAANGVVPVVPKSVAVAVSAAGVAAGVAAGAGQVALNPKQRIPFRLVSVEALSKDVRRFRFALQSEQHILGLPVGKHMFLSARVNGALVMRAYTPTSSDEDVGYFELVVKIYFKGVHPQFPDGGVFSQHLESLKVGDTVDVKGPVGHIHYLGGGSFLSHGERHEVKRIAMIAGGTGITPMYQVIKAVLRNPEDTTQMSLLFANRSEDDILLREELDRWALEHPGRLRVWYTIDSPGGDDWKFSVGRVNEEMMRGNLPAADEQTVAFMCGPPGMIQYGCIPNLEKLGYPASRMFTF